MPKEAFGGSSPAGKGNAGRQVLIIVVVIVVFALLLAAYLQFGGGVEPPAAATGTAMPALTDTAVLAADTPVPSDTPEPLPTDSAAPAAPADTLTPTEATAAEPATAAAVAETLVVEDIAAGDVSFATDVLPILEAGCTGCHGGSSPRAGISLESYDDVMAAAARKVVVPGDADASRLAQVVISGKMPPRGDKLTEEEIQFIVDWINAEAPNN